MLACIKINRSDYTILFLLLVFFPAIASGQNIKQKVSLEFSNAPLKTILTSITEKTGFDFFYSNDQVSDQRKLSINVKDITLEAALNIIAGRDYSWTFKDKTITLKSRKSEPANSPPVASLGRDTTFYIKGRVTDTTGAPLEGATVVLKGTTKTAVTDKKGEFELQDLASRDAKLLITYVGYTTTEVDVKNQSSISVMLQSGVKELNDVVVIGYGTQNRRDVIGAVSSVSSKDMETTPGGTINTSLQGKIAGLQITTNSGEPGAGASVALRGVSSINGASQPLYIIDGMMIDGSSYSSLADGATFSPLNDINPADIQSIEVLKDAASASIYGSRASNGVIIITTKTGKLLKNPEVRISVNAGPVEMIRKIGVLNAPQFRSAYIEAVYNQLGILTDKQAVIDSLHPYYRGSTDWQELMYQRAFQYKADLSLSGGSKDNAINYFFSASYRDEQPVIKKAYYKQQFASGRINYKINKRLSANTNFNISNYSYSRVRTGIGTQSLVYQNLSIIPVYNPYDPITGAIVPLFEGIRRSPLAIAEYAKNKVGRYRFLVKQDLNIEVIKDLNYYVNIGLDYSNTKTDLFDPPILNNPTTGSVVQSQLATNVDKSILFEHTLTYKKKFKGNNLTALLGQSYQSYSFDYTRLTGVGLIDGQISTIGGASAITVYDESISKNALASVFGRLNYDYKGQYLLSLVLRRDGSSRFSSENRYGYFPSVAAGWRFSQEPFMNRIYWLRDGKLRVSYGITGNQGIGNYSGQGIINRAGTYLGQVATVANGLPNPFLKWETTKEANIGLDLQLFNGRVSFTTDIYDKRTNDLLFNVEIPTETGFTTIPLNFGAMRNRGIEFSVSGIIMKRTFKWDTKITTSINRNKITELPNNLDYRPNLITLARVGQPVGVFYGLKALGVYANDVDNVFRKDPATGQSIPYRKGSATGQIYKGGDVIWEDLNGDGVINDADLQIIGNPNPKLIGGLQNSFSYKQFAVDVFFNFSIGNEVFNDLKRTLDGSAFDSNFSTDQLRRWGRQGDHTDIPRLVKGDAMQNYAVSSRFVENASFVRLQTVSLRYDVKTQSIQKLGLKSLTIGIVGVNLLTFSNYNGYDPEVSSSSNVLEFGIDNGAFPRTRSVNISLNAKF